MFIQQFVNESESLRVGALNLEPWPYSFRRTKVLAAAVPENGPPTQLVGRDLRIRPPPVFQLLGPENLMTRKAVACDIGFLK